MRIGTGFMVILASGLFSGALSGCVGDRDPWIPASAELETGGDGRLKFVAPDNGIVYLQDTSIRHKEASSPILRDESFTVDPLADKIAVGGRLIPHPNPLNPNHVYTIYFGRQ